MNILIIMRLLKIITLFGIGAAAVSTNTQAEDILAQRGKIYRDCRVLSKDQHGVTFRHSRGVAKVAYTSMPAAQRGLYSYHEAPRQAPAINTTVTAQAQRRNVSYYGAPRQATAIDTHVTAQAQRSSGITFVHRNGKRYVSGYGSGFQTTSSGRIVTKGMRPVYIANNNYSRAYYASSRNLQSSYNNYGYAPANNNYSGGSFADRLYNQHFAQHAQRHYGNGSNALVGYSPARRSYVNSSYRPFDNRTFVSGPSGGSLVPTRPTGFISSGPIAPALVSARR
jgi:hypothetical protein